jgi:beta-phosphoglucomutase-like phosphatase (HAD superfamily)
MQLEAVLERCPELRALFDSGDIITQDDVSRRKPDPEGIEKLLGPVNI